MSELDNMHKKIVSLMLVSLCLISVSMTAFANDHQDRRFSFIFSRHEDKTDFLKKEDSTPVYMKCHSASAPYYAMVLAARGGAPGGAAPASNEIYMQTGSVEFIPIYSYDPNYVYGIIGLPTVQDSAAWGYWSPDSV